MWGGATYLDSNRFLHTLIRNIGWIDDLEGRIGGALVLVEMAASIRRAYEAVSGKLLLEEDFFYPGIWTPEARNRHYGSGRLFDGKADVRRQIARTHGLDDTRVRVYCEGPSEVGAIRACFPDLVDSGGGGYQHQGGRQLPGTAPKRDARHQREGRGL